MKKRAFALFLLFAFLLPLAGCGGDQPTETGTLPPTAAESTAAPETAEAVTEYAPNLPDVNYDGYGFKVLYTSDSWGYNVFDLISDGLTGEVVNDAVYNRNIAVEDALNIKFVGIPYSDPVSFAKQDYISGLMSYDFMMGRMNESLPLALDGYFADWNTLLYFDADDPWWDSNAAEQLSICGKLFTMAGNISTCPAKYARFVYFSKGVAEDYHIESLYDLVRGGKWTIDKMTEIVSSVSTDLNGDGVYNGEDCLGLLTEVSSFYIIGCGVTLTYKDENDIPYVDCINERTVRVIEKVDALMNVPNATCSYEKAHHGQDIGTAAHLFEFVRQKYFAAEHFLFTQVGTSVVDEFSGMPRGFGVLPSPKFDEEQENYWHLPDRFACSLLLPATAENMDRTDVIINYWAYSSDEVRDAFFEVTLKKRKADAPDDTEMFEIILSSIKYELFYIIDVGISDVLSSASPGTLISSYERRESSIEKTIDKYFGDLLDS